MVDPIVWKNSVALAKRGDLHAANRVVILLLQWTRAELPSAAGLDEEEMAADFVCRAIRNQFVQLPDLPPARLDAFLRKCWRRFVINWYGREQRRRTWQIPRADLRQRNEESEEEDEIDNLVSKGLSPEQTLLLHEEITALRLEVACLTPLNQRIFRLFFDEEWCEPEIARILEMSPGNVAWHVHAIRRRLIKWRAAREG